jgi:hypothetical protein
MVYDKGRSDILAEVALKKWQRGERPDNESPIGTIIFGLFCVLTLIVMAFFNLGLRGVLEWMLRNLGRSLAISAVALAWGMFLLKKHLPQIYGMLELSIFLWDFLDLRFSVQHHAKDAGHDLLHQVFDWVCRPNLRCVQRDRKHRQAVACSKRAVGFTSE